jgi:hypothetical protein
VTAIAFPAASVNATAHDKYAATVAAGEGDIVSLPVILFVALPVLALAFLF